MEFPPLNQETRAGTIKDEKRFSHNPPTQEELQNIRKEVQEKRQHNAQAVAKELLLPRLPAISEELREMARTGGHTYEVTRVEYSQPNDKSLPTSQETASAICDLARENFPDLKLNTVQEHSHIVVQIFVS